jgi:hypothetical protein
MLIWKKFHNSIKTYFMTTIYIRTLKRAEHTVFCVQDGQKFYYDSQFNRRIPYSSGQQIKRSLLDKLSAVINQQPAPTTFLFDVTKGQLKEGEVFATCDPSFPDQLLGGWMKAAKGGNEKTVKRRSPLSISAMRGLHPLLAGIENENISFDRSDRANNQVIVRNEKGEAMTTEEIANFLVGKDRSLSRKWIPDNRRAGGLFVMDIAIDLRRLFSVAINPLEPEISPEIEARLREAGWIESANVFGPCLVAPVAVREKLIPAIAEAIIEWSITSNQARTFSLMETLAVTISDNANKIAASIRAKLSEEEENKAYPIVEEELDGVNTYVSLTAGGYIRTKSETYDALEKAKQKLIDLMMAFDYENQL